MDLEMAVKVLQKIRRYLDASMKFFKSAAETMPSLKSVEQLILILLVTNILKITHRIVTVDEKDIDEIYLELVFDEMGEFNSRNEDC